MLRVHMHGHGIELPEMWPPCCIGSAANGASGCTCWSEVYDRKQRYVSLPQVIVPKQRERMCEDCAFRPDSPERTGDERYAHSGDRELEDLVYSDDDFACHQGMRRLVAMKHRRGKRVAAPPGCYEPGVVERYAHRPGDDWGHFKQIALKADGTPADLCAGLRAARERVAREEQER